MPRQFRPSVCPSHVCIVSKRIILVFRHQGSLRKSDPNTRGSNFQPTCGYIWERVLDRDIVTMEDEYKVVCALLNGAAFDDLE